MKLAVRVAGLMLAIVLGLTAVNLAVCFRHDWLVQAGWENLFNLFCLDREANLPTWYQSSTLLLCAVRMRYIAWVRDGQNLPYVLHWKVLSIIFAFLSLDELASIHELAAVSVRTRLGTSGLLYQGWVIPGAIFVLIVTAAYWGFVFRQPVRIRNLLILSAVLYVGGALGMEMVGGYHLDKHDPQGRSTTYIFLMTTEEFLEMMGVLVFMYTLFQPEITADSTRLPTPASDQ
jgi:hypothetical protein